MKTFSEFKQHLITEAQATEDLKQMTFYHGTTNREAALGIAKNGIQPGVTKETKGKNGMMTPVVGKTYATPHIGYAQTYALGGAVAGSKTGADHLKKYHGDHGYVFAVHGHELGHVDPDEDSVGEAVYHRKHGWLNRLAQQHLTDGQQRRIKDGEYAEFARSGKKLVKKMSDHEKLDVIRGGAHIAHEGPLKPHSVYRIHRDKIPMLKDDGSNFFDHAEKIDPKDI
jgi:hypothetical protein